MRANNVATIAARKDRVEQYASNESDLARMNLALQKNEVNDHNNMISSTLTNR
jgi:hypothetical protein